MALLLSSLPLLLSATAPRSIRSFSARRRGPRILLCRAQSSSSKTDAAQVYNGVYGPWSIDSTDVREVFLYRAGLVTSAATFVAVASTAFLPEDNVVKSVISTYQDLLFSIGAGSLGVSLLLIHIYVTPLKRALQVLWTVGVAGSILVASNFATPADRGLVEFVVENPAAVWAVGPLFAALTGLVFKEGLCYGKLEAALLFFVIPSLLLGHLVRIPFSCLGAAAKRARRRCSRTWVRINPNPRSSSSFYIRGSNGGQHCQRCRIAGTPAQRNFRSKRND